MSLVKTHLLNPLRVSHASFHEGVVSIPGEAKILTLMRMLQVQPGNTKVKLRLKQLCGFAMAWGLQCRKDKHFSKLCIKCVTVCMAMIQSSDHKYGAEFYVELAASVIVCCC